DFIGNLVAMTQLKQLILKVANTQAPIYIRGESGTGKEMVARLIHNNGPRAESPFIAINCGAIPTELMESEFFGHIKGSFTGATTDKDGLFRSADGGTLFLDEIADLPLTMQVKLLRAIQERAIRPVGSEREIAVNVRILSASHKNLSEQVESGLFRQDLFYRINVIEVEIPPLRKRTEDIPELVSYFTQRIGSRNNSDSYQLTDAALQKLTSYSFPGNIRELENIIERCIALASDNIITEQDLLLHENSTATTTSSSERPKDCSLDDYLEKIERNEIKRALIETDGNKTAAAELLGISFRTMRYKCKKLNIE
ncbi:MAG: sigma-54 dependent transcriptional regulator, partial [Kangiellaceae bacterium]|nr:sigma-54 dependent transcriptional regulator [Kangiellaceae bacterium]